ncbi:hypothetical protein N9Y74_03030 [Alphaproteobacteria bacterium]|nr:hypothetical protein [Alphaproteobacteria bacterium]
MINGPSPVLLEDRVDREDRGDVGLVWALGGGLQQTPKLTLGFQSLDIKSNSDVDTGFDTNIRFSLNGWTLPNEYSIRLAHLFGEREAVGNVGAGYDSGTQSYFATLGVQDGSVRLGADITMETVTPSLELLTLSRREAPSKGCSLPDYEAVEDEEEGGLYCEYTGSNLPMMIDFQPLRGGGSIEN